MKVFTIGFTEKKAEKFFSLIKDSGAKRVVDVRLNNVSQLAGFAKKDDLKYFLKEICGAEYVHLPSLAPTKDILDAYKKGGMRWDEYEARFLDLMEKRRVESTVRLDLLEDGCLLCSEHLPHMCHRRLVVEYLEKTTGINMEVRHLK